MTRWLAVALALFVVGAGPRPAVAQALIADLSNDLIAVTTGFSGAELLLFGTTDGVGDLVIVVRGPLANVTVRRKERTAGVWINRASATFEQAPIFYHLTATRAVEAILNDDVLALARIGFDNLQLEPRERMSTAEAAAFRAALIRNKQDQGLYDAQIGQIRFLGDRLFRTEVSFPANVSTGRYQVDVFLVRDGGLVSRTSTPLQVNRLGFEAGVFDFAHEQSTLYGLIAIAIALMAGWFAGFVFRKI